MNQPVFAIFHPPFNDIGKHGDQQSAQNDGTQQTNNLKSATKLFSVLLASKRPLITELADK
ncbi:hypothetical protein PO059_23280, partial [Bacteroides thetaiotaomicron]|nr:hypothetical protein [Bacteroides thetaiotaomicron]